MKLKTPGKYDSILVAVQFNNFYSGVDEELRKKEPIREGGFNINTLNLPVVQSFRVKKDAPPAEVSLTPLRIQYHEKDVGTETTDGTLEIIRSVYEERKKTVPENEWDNVEFAGAIIRVVYKLDGNDTEKIRERFRGRAGRSHKRVILKLNYQDEENLNYNVEFVVDLAKHELSVSFDINDIYLPTKGIGNLEEILRKIDETLSNESALSELLW